MCSSDLCFTDFSSTSSSFTVPSYIYATYLRFEVLEVEIDLSIPGPIKIFNRVSQQYTRQASTNPLHDNDGDLLLYTPRGEQRSVSFSVQFLRVGEPGEVRVARLGGMDKFALSALNVDRDAGYVMIFATNEQHGPFHGCSYIWWLDGAM